MTARWYYAEDAATVVEWTDRVRLPVDPEGVAIGIGKHADQGSGWEGDLLVDDPGLTLSRPKIHRRVYCVQESAPAGAQVVGNWFITGVKVRRGGGGLGRVYVVTMADENSLLSRRKWTGADADRPSETDIARIRWALLETELNVLSPDETYIDTTGPVTLEASDLRDHSPEDMLMTMFQRTKKEHWVKYEEAAAVGGTIVSSSVASPTVITTTSAHGLYTGMQIVITGHSGSTPDINGTHTITVTGATTYTIPVNVTVGGTGGTSTTVGRYVLCYFNPNTSLLLPSTISISNDTADTIIGGDNPTSLVYPLSDDAELDGTGARLSSGLIVPHLGASKRVYVQDTDVGDAYAYVDNVATPPIPLKTEAEATAYANAELADLGEPDDEVSTTLTIAGARMNLVMAGMIVPVHATHYPNYTADTSQPGWSTGFVNTRVKKRLITQLGPETFEMPLTLSPMKTTPCEQFGPTPAGFYGPLGGLPAYGSPAPPYDPNDNVHYWVGGTGGPHVPSSDHSLDNVGFPQFAQAHGTLPSGFFDTWWSTGNAARCLVIGPGTMTILLVPGTEGNGPYDLTLACLDGVAEHVIESRTNQAISPTGITEVEVEIPESVEGVTGIICNFWVDIHGFYGGTRIVGFGGFHWVPA